MNVFKDNIYDNNRLIFLFGLQAVKSLVDSAFVYFLNKNVAIFSYNIIGENIDISTFGNQIIYGSYALVMVKVFISNIKYVNYMHIIITFFCLGCLVAITFII